MKKIAHGFIVILLLPFLISCNENRTYDYYMQHPAVLKQAIKECQSSLEKTKDQAEQCEIVMYAAANIMSLISEQQANPEKFGQRILEAQATYVKMKQDVARESQSLDELKRKQASPAEIRIAQDDLYKTKKACAEQWREIKELLAVLGMSNPG